MKLSRILNIVFAVVIVVLLIVVLNKSKEVTSMKSSITDLRNNINSLESKLEESESNKEKLEQQVRNVVYTRESLISSSQIGSNRYVNSKGSSISEEDVYSSKGTATVVFRKSGCDYMILENNSGYIVAEWMGGNDPDKGDNVAGEFNSYGTKEFYNTTTSSKSNLWVDDYMLSRSRALEKINDKCH